MKKKGGGGSLFWPTPPPFFYMIFHWSEKSHDRSRPSSLSGNYHTVVYSYVYYVLLFVLNVRDGVHTPAPNHLDVRTIP